MKVSVLTPVYATKKNGRLSFLKRAIASVQTQGLDDYEHFILDDGSPLDIKTYIDSLNDPHITYRRAHHVYHKDPVTQWDIMLMESQGDYKIILGSDDEFTPGGLKYLKEFLNSHPSYVAVTGKVRWYDTDGIVHPHYAQEFPKNSTDLIAWNKVHCCATMFRDSVLRATWQPYEKAGFCVDWYLWLLLNEQGMIGCIDDYVLNYYRHDDTFEQYTRKDPNYRVNCEADGKIKTLIRRGLMDAPQPQIEPIIGGSRVIGSDLMPKLLLKGSNITFLSFVKDEGQFYLKRMLNSVLPYVPKLIVVDTGSSDNTMEILDEYSSKFSNLVHFQHKCSEKQIYKAINKALSLVETDWVFIIAGDEAMLPEDLYKIPGAIADAKEQNARTVRVSYLDFIGDDKHYHVKYPCLAYRIWSMKNGFKFGGDFQGDIWMGYEDGIQTGGVETKKNLPPELTVERLDIYFHHYARCKPKDVLLEKRKKYYKRRIKNPTPRNVLESAKNCPFYTLDLPLEEYTGPQAGLGGADAKNWGFFTGSPDWMHFAEPILKSLKERDFNVVQCFDVDNMDWLYDRVDVLWVEWAEDYLLKILRERHECKVVVRLHRYELDKPHITAVNWSNCDLLVFVNDEVRNNFRKKCPEANVRTAVIPNAVDTDQILFQKRKSFGKELVAYSIRFGDVKDYKCAIDVMRKLPKSYNLTIRAMPPPEPTDLIEYADGLNVEFITDPIDLETIADKTDVNALLCGKDMLLSTSKYESFHYAIAEALCSGLQVFVRDWDRGGNPGQFWEKWLCDSPKAMVNKIKAWVRKPPHRKQKVLKANRQYVVDNFGRSVITDKFVAEIAGPTQPHVCVIVPVYNNPHFIDECIKSLLGQYHDAVTVIAVNDGSTDDTLERLLKYKDQIVIINALHGGAHSAMSIGLSFARNLGPQYTVFAGSDDVYEPDYISKMVEKAMCNNYTLVYPNFSMINGIGLSMGEYRAKEPDLEILKKDCYVCDHSLVSSEMWDEYGWELRVDDFLAYSVFHTIVSNFVMFPGRQAWVDEFLWKYRLHEKNLHYNKKQERKGQRERVLKDIFGE
jgi:glycosyltransferase involved in cell wall biosynthesis